MESYPLTVGIIPKGDFINYVIQVERKNSSDNPQVILTRIRKTYYGTGIGGIIFDMLIPDATFIDEELSPRILDDNAFDSSGYIDTYIHLTSHPDEFGAPNPSLYVIDSHNQR